MKSLYESILDIDPIDFDNNITKYLSSKEFQKLYKRKLKSIDIDKDNPICIIGKYIPMGGLCRKFNAKNISISGIYPEIKIKEMLNFASDCKNLVSFNGPNAHMNYSDIETLGYFFDSNTSLKTFDLKGIAESAKKIQNIDHIFNACASIENIDLGDFDFSKLNGAVRAFRNCMNLKHISMGNSNALVRANNMCRNNIRLMEFNAPNMVLSGDMIFYNCPSLKNINVRYIDVSNEYYNIFDNCTELMNVNMFGFGKNTKHDEDYINLSWAISLSDKSWDFLFKNLGDGENMKIKLPDTLKKEKLIEKYSIIIKKYNIELI